MNRATRLVRFDAAPGDPYRPVSTPIYQTATFEQASAVEFGPYDYSRSANPTRAVLEAQLAALEGAAGATAFASGMAALTTVCRLVGPGEEIVAGDDLYGGTDRLLAEIGRRSGVRVRFVDATDLDALAAAVGRRTRLVLVESPTNPLQRIVDLAGAAAIARAAGAWLAVDNSILSPYLQRPLELGADLVLHSATKYLGGHSDVTGGVVAAADGDLAAEIAFLQNAEGNGLGPFDAWLLLRGLKTLGVRIEAQQRSAGPVARFLADHPAVTRVHWPGLADHPGAELHARQADGPGALLGFETGDLAVSRAVVEGTRLFTTCVSFGSVGSSISLPCRMSHAAIPAAVRAARRLPEDLVRVSIGIEHGGDLIDDLAGALARATGARCWAGPFEPVSVS